MSGWYEDRAAFSRQIYCRRRICVPEKNMALNRQAATKRVKWGEGGRNEKFVEMIILIINSIHAFFFFFSHLLLVGFYQKNDINNNNIVIMIVFIKMIARKMAKQWTRQSEQAMPRVGVQTAWNWRLHGNDNLYLYYVLVWVFVFDQNLCERLEKWKKIQEIDCL
jgi:hypothetical protein